MKINIFNGLKCLCACVRYITDIYIYMIKYTKLSPDVNDKNDATLHSDILL